MHRTKCTSRRLALTAVLAILFSIHGKQEDGFDGAGQKATTACAEAKYTSALSQIFKTEAIDAAAEIDQASTHVRAHKLAALYSSNEHQSTGHWALALLLQEEISDAHANNKATSETKLEAAAALESRTMRLLTFLQLSVKAVTNHQAASAINTVNWPKASAITSDITPTLATEIAENCTIDKLGEDSDIKKAQVNHKSIYKMKMLPDTAFKPPQLKIQATAGGSGAATGWQQCSDKEGVVASGGESINTNYFGARLLITPATITTESTDIFKDSDKRSSCKTGQYNSGFVITQKEYTARHVCKATLAAYKLPTPPADQKLATLKTSAKLASLIKLLRQEPTSSDKQEANTASEIEKVLGTSETEFEANFVKYVKTEKRSFTVGGKTLTCSFLELAGQPEADELEAYLTAQAKSRWQTTKAAGGANDDGNASTQKCTAIPTADKCNNKDGCEFKDGKCQAKVTTATGTDGKPTNTTRSNSFVIKKAPLLLTFFLIG
uniref:Variant surface glycoprotein 1125.283 n=1 Tax=Trypanosoma brucei TaxID=5691 RepID=A0A1J0R5J3_9TRYP|nr:variant surface glycoprotein 1125.283 [Trypanosoma brucei]